MNLKQMMKDDLSIFYDVNEFGKSALYEGNEISIKFLNDYEFENFRGEVISLLKKDMPTVSNGKLIEIDSKIYKIMNSIAKNENEWIVGICLK